MNTPRKLEKGDAVGIIGTGSPLSPERFAAGAAELERRGYRLKVPLNPSLFYASYEHGFTNGSAEMRAEAFMSLIEDSEVSVIIAARGGYGTLDILPLVDFSRIKAAGKLVVGCSDVTALLTAIRTKASLPSVHGATLGSLFADSSSSKEARSGVDALLATLSDTEYRLNAQCSVLNPGSAEGRVLAGNLSVFTNMLGTSWDVDYTNAILVLEEVSEAPYRVHRSLTQLKLAGKLDRLSALVFGRFSKCTSPHGPSVEKVLQDAVGGILETPEYPVLSDFEFGHWGLNLPVSLGCRASVCEGRFTMLDSPLG